MRASLTRRCILAEAALLVLLSGSIAQDSDWSLPSESWPLLGNGSHHKGGTPYKPGGIVDPFSDVNCETEKCTGGKASCSAYPYRLCQSYANCPNKVCLHKQLFPMLPEDLLLFIVMFIIAVCAGAAGIGGGGLNVPILMMISSFGIKEAVPLSHAAVMGNAFAQLLMNAPQRHPDAPQRPLIHYELAILALPAQLGGNSLGVVVGRIFPPTLLIILSLAMLGLAASKTLMKGIEVLKKFRESKRTVAAARDQVLSLPLASSSAREQQAIESWVPPRRPSIEVQVDRATNVSKDLGLPTATQDLECVRTWSGTNLMPRSPDFNQPNAPASSSHAVPSLANGAASDDDVPVRIPWAVIWTMIGFNVIFCIDFLGMSPDVFHIKKCTAPYWVFLIGLYPFVIASIWIGIKSLKALKAYHEERNDPPIPGDPEVDLKLVTLFPLASVIIGLVAGLVGLGGGEFMVPLLLEFGLQPRVATATSGFLILFATSSNIVHYLVANIMQPFIAYGFSVFLLAFLGALTGLCIRDTKFLRTHNYLLVFLLTGLLFISAALLAYRGFGMSKLDWGFKPFCSAGGG